VPELFRAGSELTQANFGLPTVIGAAWLELASDNNEALAGNPVASFVLA
jgi:hypothetical protein